MKLRIRIVPDTERKANPEQLYLVTAKGRGWHQAAMLEMFVVNPVGTELGMSDGRVYPGNWKPVEICEL